MKRLPKQGCSSHFVRPEKRKLLKSLALALNLTLTLALTLALTITFNHLAIELLLVTMMLYGLLYST